MAAMDWMKRDADKPFWRAGWALAGLVIAAALIYFGAV